jgi:polyisoprenoid-binding protein YceI
MRKTIMVVSMLSVFLAACAQQAAAPTETEAMPAAVRTTDAVQVEPTEAPLDTPTEAPLTTAAPVQTSELAETENAIPATGLTTYQIVPGESTVTYEVGETFFENNRFNLAVGVTPQVSGAVMLDPSNPQSATIGEIQVDISLFQSDSSRRDNFIRGRFLESSTYPLAVFKPTSITGLPESYSEGQEISFQVTGDLTVKQTTKPVTFDVTAKLENGTLNGTATTTILLSNFDVGPITLAGMLQTEDEVKLTLNFVARSE